MGAWHNVQINVGLIISGNLAIATCNMQHPIRDILDRISSTLSNTERFDPDSSQRVFTLASTDYGEVMIVPKLLRHLQQIQSPVRINLWPQYESDLSERMHFGSIDFAIDNIPITDEAFHTQVLI